MMATDAAPRGEVIVGDALAELRRLPAATADMVLTSPPYFRLRDYAADGQLGLEACVDDWVSRLLAVVGELERVLVPSGSLWLNLGDTFSTHASQGAGRKSLLLGPERLALALTGSGWQLRNKIVWQKANPMPTSARDRLACTWEALYVFVRQPDYFFDLDAVRRPHLTRLSRPSRPSAKPGAGDWRGPNAGGDNGLAALKARGLVGHPLGKNPGDVWRIPASNYRGSHHATFPVALSELAVRAGCPEARCRACRAPYRRAVDRVTATRGALRPPCTCGAPSEPGLVLDPFFGAGTTALGAIEQRRDWLGIELSPAFAAEARARVATFRPSWQQEATPP